MRQPEDGERGQHEQAEREFVEQHLALEQGQHEADVAAGDRQVRDDRRHDEGQAERADREVVPLQPQHREAEHAGEHDAQRQAGEQADPERQVELRHRDPHAVGAQPVEDGIAERRVAGEAADDVPTLRERGHQQHVDTELQQDRAAVPGQRGERGHEGHDHDGHDHDEPDAGNARDVHAVLPSSPAGRTISTSTRMPKLATSR